MVSSWLGCYQKLLLGGMFCFSGNTRLSANEWDTGTKAKDYNLYWTQQNQTKTQHDRVRCKMQQLHWKKTQWSQLNLWHMQEKWPSIYKLGILLCFWRGCLRRQEIFQILWKSRFFGRGDPCYFPSKDCRKSVARTLHCWRRW